MICTFYSSNSILSCNKYFKSNTDYVTIIIFLSKNLFSSSAGIIECDTQVVYYNNHNFTRLEENYRQFSLGKVDTTDYASLDRAHLSFSLYPRNLEDTLWLDQIIFNNKFDKQMALFHLKSMPYYGFRVIRLDCHSRLVSIFAKSTYEEVIQVGYSNKDVNIFGSISIE